MTHLHRFHASKVWLTMLLVIAALTFAAGPRSEAQSYSVIHDFTGAQDGASPLTGLTLDRAGNLYGTTAKGGYQGSGCTNGGCGTVFKLTHSGSNWLFSPLYAFKGQVTVWDGEYPSGRVVFGPDGALYGTTEYGGFNGPGCGAPGCGTVFKLTPSPSFCRSVSCGWNETQLHAFTGAPDGADAQGEIAFDSMGNLYGATVSGGANGPWGTVYQLVPGHGAWQESLLYSFSQRLDGGIPAGGVTVGVNGDVYGSTLYGGANGLGDIFRLVRSGDSWQLNTLYDLTPFSPQSIYGVVLDSAGNLYGGGTAQGNQPVVFELSSPQWTLDTLYTLSSSSGNSIRAQLMMDGAGDLYGTTLGDGRQTFGSVFKLTPSANGWVYTDLYDFAFFGDDGRMPYSNVVVDAQGNLYGTASEGGRYGYGVVWKITP